VIEEVLFVLFNVGDFIFCYLLDVYTLAFRSLLVFETGFFEFVIGFVTVDLIPVDVGFFTGVFKVVELLFTGRFFVYAGFDILDDVKLEVVDLVSLPFIVFLKLKTG
jgi:hypothetical protein